MQSALLGSEVASHGASALLGVLRRLRAEGREPVRPGQSVQELGCLGLFSKYFVVVFSPLPTEVYISILCLLPNTRLLGSLSQGFSSSLFPRAQALPSSMINALVSRSSCAGRDSSDFPDLGFRKGLSEDPGMISPP